jgi:hypothetical protein
MKSIKGDIPMPRKLIVSLIMHAHAEFGCVTAMENYLIFRNKEKIYSGYTHSHECRIYYSSLNLNGRES